MQKSNVSDDPEQNGGGPPVYVEILSKHNSPRTTTAYIKYLDLHGLKLGWTSRISLIVSDKIATKRIGLAIFGVLVASGFAGALGGCGTRIGLSCGVTTFHDEKTGVIDQSNRKVVRSQLGDPHGPLDSSANAASASPEAESLTTTNGLSETTIRTDISGASFNLAWAQAFLIACTFLLAFSRWMIENRQDSMSEIFKRKKEVNLLLLQDDKGIFQDLVAEAVTTRTSDLPEGKVLHLEEIAHTYRSLRFKAKIFMDLKSVEINQPKPRPRRRRWFPEREHLSDIATPDLASRDFSRTMFVFMELDNLEFAFVRYITGHLDPEQMFRACEIFESRCLNRSFRYIATEQGLKYYSPGFHGVIKPMLVKGEYLSDVVADEK